MNLDPTELAAFVEACRVSADHTPLAALADFLAERGGVFDANEIRSYLADAAGHADARPAEGKGHETQMAMMLWEGQDDRLAYRRLLILIRLADQAERLKNPRHSADPPPAFTATALRQRGWTPKLIAEFAPPPEIRKRPRRRAFHLYDARRIVKIERSLKFLASYNARRRRAR